MEGGIARVCRQVCEEDGKKQKDGSGRNVVMLLY